LIAVWSAVCIGGEPVQSSNSQKRDLLGEIKNIPKDDEQAIQKLDAKGAPSVKL
jgi:hypothetical protein